MLKLILINEAKNWGLTKLTVIPMRPDTSCGKQCRQMCNVTLWHKWHKLFTPLRVGWPPTPQVYFGRVGLRWFSPWGSQAKKFHFPPPWGAPQAKEFSLFPPVGAPQAREFHFSPPWRLPKLGNLHFSPPWGLPKLGNFHTFPRRDRFPSLIGIINFSTPLEALQAAEFQIARQRRLDSLPNPVFCECVSMFLQWFPSKHGTLHFCRHKTGRKHHVRQCFQFPYLPTVENIAITVFLQFFQCQCRSQLQHI